MPPEQFPSYGLSPPKKVYRLNNGATQYSGAPLPITIRTSAGLSSLIVYQEKILIQT